MNSLRLRLLALLLLAVAIGAAQSAASAPDDWLSRWLNQVSEIQAAQPHWITPIVTVTPRLEQEFRFDVNRQIQANARPQWGLGGGKGLEFIPFDRVEIIIGEPNYLIHNNPNVHDGFADPTFLLKYRIASANETHGNYIITAFVGGSIPTGSYANGLTSATLTPTLAAGKGYGNFSVQSTLGIQVPAHHTLALSKTLAWNTALQYHLSRFKLWPELELNQSHFIDGRNAGLTQVFLTPGIVLGRFPLHHRVAFTGGIGYQIATSAFHPFNHNLILTFRLPF